LHLAVGNSLRLMRQSKHYLSPQSCTRAGKINLGKVAAFFQDSATLPSYAFSRGDFSVRR
jgi:hypothetical protein